MVCKSSKGRGRVKPCEAVPAPPLEQTAQAAGARLSGVFNVIAHIPLRGEILAQQPPDSVESDINLVSGTIMPRAANPTTAAQQALRRNQVRVVEYLKGSTSAAELRLWAS
jgi:hypothetical protein